MMKGQQNFDIGLIRDVANSLAQPMRQVIDAMVGLFLQDDQIDTLALTQTTQVDAHTDAAPKDTAGTSSSPPPVYFVLPRLQGMPQS